MRLIHDPQPTVCRQIRLLQTNIHTESYRKCCSQVFLTDIYAMELDFATNPPSLSDYWVMLRLGAGRMADGVIITKIIVTTSIATSDITEHRHPAALARQMCAITQARLTSAPFIYLNKITIRFIASRGKTSQG